MNININININIEIVSLDKDIETMVRKHFDHKNVKGKCENIFKSDAADCIVSPANSFGIMDGGIDAVLTLMLEKTYDEDYIGRKVRKVIEEEYGGLQPVGTCILLRTDNDVYPYLAHAPTMIRPSNVKHSANAYYGFRAVLLSIRNHNRRCKKQDKISSILTTTFCTGCGEMSLSVSLKQMRKAYNDIFVDSKSINDWGAAGKLYFDIESTREIG